ncbi:Arc family DNA-binding protein [Brucella anthropi]|uniref:Arc family DNA-binding protein n=1 Tax=Brucella anthropi TaxID=529 RepID=UPI002446A204|nr:Arc family DNA-binding protein [Brucella anthropi]MDH0368004.1 Arc family DNA-binding protein [Brucella anthropi]
MSRDDLHFRLRIPADLKTSIEVSAKANNRSMTAEIVTRLSAPEKTLRDEFAMAALTGMLHRPEIHSMIKDQDSAALFCFQQADAMIAARKGGAK